MTAQKLIKQVDYYQDKTIVRSFESLPEIKYLDSVASAIKKPKQFNSILGCLMQLNRTETNKIINNHIYQRLKDLATQLYLNNEPLIMYNRRIDCNSRIEEIKVNGKVHLLKTLCSADNGCIFFKESVNGYIIFNNQTRNLIGLEEEALEK
jgi:hypothetical protein